MVHNDYESISLSELITLIINHQQTIQFTIWMRDVPYLIDLRTFWFTELDELSEKYALSMLPRIDRSYKHPDMASD